MKKLIILTLLSTAGLFKGFAQVLPKLGLLKPSPEKLNSLPRAAGVAVPPGAQIDSFKDLSDLMPPAGDQKNQ